MQPLKMDRFPVQPPLFSGGKQREVYYNLSREYDSIPKFDEEPILPVFPESIEPRK